MADFGVFTKNADIAARAGVNAASTPVSVTETDKYVLDIEAVINARSRFNWSDVFTSLDADLQGLLKDTGASMCARIVIAQDMGGYISRIYAETLLDVLTDSIKENMKLLSDKKVQEFVNPE